MFSKIVMILGGLFLVFVLILSAGLGVWGFSLQTRLAQARADLQALKSSHERLNTDYSDLSTGSAKTNADLAAAKVEIESLQGQLKETRAENDSLTAKFKALQAKVSILYAWQFGSEQSFDQKVQTSGDEELKTLWKAARKTEADADFWKLQDYIVQSITDILGLTASPSPAVNG